MLVVTTENVPGYRRKQTLGQVFGVIVRSFSLLRGVPVTTAGSL